MSVTENVDPAIELIEGRYQHGRGPDGLAYLRSHAFFNQLPPADACLNRFLTYELDPAADEPVGGDGRASVGAIVGPQDELAEPLRRAAAVTVTSSYLAMMLIEDPPGSSWVPNRDAEPLWTFWIDHLGSTATVAFAIPDDLVRSVEREGGAYLEAEIARFGLKPGFRRRRALSHRCFEISRFGLLLRLGQTTGCSDPEFERSQTTAGAERWPLGVARTRDRYI
jgi:hypothetical protein